MARTQTTETATDAPAPTKPAAPPQPDTDHDLDRDALLRLLPPYKVIVWDNSYNTFAEVITILLKAVPGMTTERAIQLTYEIHETGSAVPYVGPQEQAELIAAKISTIGIKVTVEPE